MRAHEDDERAGSDFKSLLPQIVTFGNAKLSLRFHQVSTWRGVVNQFE